MGYWCEFKLGKAVSCTLCWRSGKSGWIFAIIVNHVFFLYPLELHALLCIKWSVDRLFPQQRASTTQWLRAAIFACINVEISVCGNERRVALICLYPATLSSPVVCVPYWWEDAHFPSLRIRDSYSFLIVGKYPNRDIVHKETASNI